MSSGAVRYGEEERVLISRPAWMLVVTFVRETFKEEAIEFNKTELRSVLARLDNARKNERFYIVWNGTYNTDLFQVNPGKIADRIRKEYEPKYVI